MVVDARVNVNVKDSVNVIRVSAVVVQEVVNARLNAASAKLRSVRPLR